MRSFLSSSVAAALQCALLLGGGPVVAAAPERSGSSLPGQVDLEPVCQGDTDDRRCGYVNGSGKMVIPIQRRFRDAGDFSNGLAAVSVSEPGRAYGLWGQGGARWIGFIDAAGQIVIPARFSEGTAPYTLPRFENGLAVVSVSRESEGVIDRQGNLLLICGPAGGHTYIYRDPFKNRQITLRGDCVVDAKRVNCEQVLDDALRFDGKTNIEQSRSDQKRNEPKIFVDLPLMCDRLGGAP